MSELKMPDDDSPRPNIASIPNMDDMLELYEKVLAELDSAISSQKGFAWDDKKANARHGKGETN